MKRGDVRWYQFQAPEKQRPVLILTRDSVIPYLNDVTIAPVTSMIRNIPSEVILGLEDGMSQDCAVNFDHLQTVRKKKVGGLITILSSEKMMQAGEALRFALGVE